MFFQNVGNHPQDYTEYQKTTLHICTTVKTSNHKESKIFEDIINLTNPKWSNIITAYIGPGLHAHNSRVMFLLSNFNVKQHQECQMQTQRPGILSST
jgi:hypothetical protein